MLLVHWSNSSMKCEFSLIFTWHIDLADKVMSDSIMQFFIRFIMKDL